MPDSKRIRELWEAGPDCLTPEQLAAISSAELAGADRARIESHLASCSRCAAERALLEGFQAAAESRDERPALAAIMAGLERQRAACWPAPAAGKRLFRPQWFSFPSMHSWALAAASLLVIAGGTFWLRTAREPGLPTGAAGAESVRSARVRAIAPAGEQPRAPEQFEWEMSGGATRYRVTVRDVEGARLWSGETGVPHLAFPLELRTQLLPGKTLTWDVEALAGGKLLASSGPMRFVLRPVR